MDVKTAAVRGGGAAIVMVGFLLLITWVAGEVTAPTAAPTPTATSTPTATATPTSTPTATPSPSPTRTPEVAISAVQQLAVTWYGPCCEGGPLGCYTGYVPYSSGDPTVVATGHGGYPCFTRLRVCSEFQCIVVTVQDHCPACGSGVLDLSRAAWDLLDQPASVMVAQLGG